MCDMVFDSVVSFRSEIFFFRNKKLWWISEDIEIMELSIEQVFGHISGIDHIDACYETTDSRHIVIFSGDRYCKVLIDGSRPIVAEGSLTELGIDATSVDAAMVWGHNGYAYVFSGSSYWRLDSSGKAQADYPRDIAVWGNIPSNLSAAITIGDQTYFFKEKVFYKFVNMKMSAEEHPTLISTYFLSCPHRDASQRVLCSGAITFTYAHCAAMHIVLVISLLMRTFPSASL